MLSKANYWEQCRKQRMADFEDLQVCAAVKQQYSQLRSAWGAETVGIAGCFKATWCSQEQRWQVSNRSAVPMPAAWLT